MAHVRRLLNLLCLMVPIVTGIIFAITYTRGRTSYGVTYKPSMACGTTTRMATHIFLPMILQENGTGIPLPTPTSGLEGRPSWGGPIAVSPVDATVWVVNPDAGSVTVMDAVRLEKIAEVPIGREPWSLAIAPDGRTIYIVDRAAGTLVVIDAYTHSVRASIPVGPEPGTIALNPTGSKAYVTVTSADEVAVVNTGRLELSACIPVAPKPYAIAITNDGDHEDADEQVYVTHLLALPRPGGSEATDDGREGRVTMIDAGRQHIVRQITLAPDAHGFPNLLRGIALAGKRAWVPVVRASPALPNRLTTTAFAAVVALDLDTGSENPSAHLPLNDQDIFGSPVNNPVAAVPAPDGGTLYAVLAGSDLVEVIDVSDPDQPRLVKFLPAGSNPRGLALSQDGRRGYVMSYLSRSVTVLDLENLKWIAEVPVTVETLEPEVLRGKILFNNASNPKLTQGSWLSCASCHPDSGSDGVTWMFPDGPRQTPALWYAGQTRPWHWSAALDEPQDVEETIKVIQHGLGLAPGADPPLLGTPNAGRSADLDALAAFLERGIRAPALPPSEDVALGRSLFEATGCTACHGGATWTTSALPGPPGTLDPDGNGMVDAVLREVGTLNPGDVRGQTGFDPPSLLHVRLTAPYLHDGSMPTLEALLASGHPDPHGSGNGLDDKAIAALVDFLRAIEADTTPFRHDAHMQ
jgi:YVTN family beta-propeller protein